jgi:hypothetical protein
VLIKAAYVAVRHSVPDAPHAAKLVEACARVRCRAPGEPGR